MFKHFIKQYFRNISRRKVFSIVNIAGLSFAVAFIILIGEYLFYEYNYNHDIKNVDNIYRLVETKYKGYDIFDYRIKDQINENVSGVKSVCLLNRFGVEANVKNSVYKIDNMLVVSPEFFRMFNTKFLAGNHANALNTTDAVVLTETTAKRIFGTVNIIGRVIKLNHQVDMMVTGVVKDLPENINIKGDLFVNYKNSVKKRLSYKGFSMADSEKIIFNTFVLLKNGIHPEIVASQISSLNKLNDFLYPKDVELVKLKTNYLNTSYSDFDLTHGNINLIKILLAIGIFILLLAVINFFNLSTASQTYRLKEISVKKCFGADRTTLIKQLLAESLFTCLFSSILGIVIAELFLPYFNQYIGEPLSLELFRNISFLGLFLLFILFLSLLTGLLPSLILSRTSPLKLLSGKSILKGSNKNYRGLLTIFQFSISIILISALIVITRQIDFVKHRNPGFNTDKLLYVKVQYTLKDRMNVIYNKLSEFHNLKSITKTFGIPGGISVSLNGFSTIAMDSTTMKTFGFRIKEGRKLLLSDKTNNYVLINEAGLSKLGNGDYKNYKIGKMKIAGVVADFNFSSLHNKIGPLVLMYSNFFDPNYITMRVSSPVDESINYIKKTWDELCSDYPLEFGFYDEYFAAMYKKEDDFAALVKIFSFLAIIISSMGIFGLSLFQAEQKIKEIGIRKVLGASSSEIMALLTKSFSKWVILANIIAIPAAYYLMKKWLQDFAYRIDMSLWIFALSGFIALVISLITISFNTLKAVNENPVNSLRNE